MENYNKTFEVKKVKGWKKRFEIYDNGTTIASVDFPSRWKKAAILDAGGKRYKVARRGFWRSRLELQAEQSPFTKWTLPMTWKGALSIRTDDNGEYSFKRKGVFKCSWFWYDQSQNPLMEMKSAKWSFQKKGTIGTNQSNSDTFLLLSMIGWFVLICYEDDAAAAAVAAG